MTRISKGKVKTVITGKCPKCGWTFTVDIPTRVKRLDLALYWWFCPHCGKPTKGQGQ